MTEPATHFVPMPPNDKFPKGHNLALRDRVLVVIGANGSGKTRFGAWLDEKDLKLHYRVSAHRCLIFPKVVKPMDLVEAESNLLTGGRRQKQSPTALLNNFELLLTLLVSESFNVSDQYRVAMQAEDQYIKPPQTRLDLLKQIWETVLPSRELVITGSRVEARNRQDKIPYHPKEMSDGERGIFHLIGEALSVPKNGVFIVDEPELHLHRAIQARLWDAVEAARPDCTFVYITHDLGFATSRKDATKVWLKEYRSGTWDWEEVPESGDLPESLLLEVMGSRRPILFVEGDRSSLDYFIYGKVFPEYTIVPCGSCESVVHSTCSFTGMAGLHHNQCGGLVDNDGRAASDIQKLRGLGVAVLPVALVENLFLIEPVLALAAEKLGHNATKVVTQVKDRVLAKLNRNSERVISNLTRQEIEAALRTFGAGGDGAAALSKAFTDASSAIDPATIYAKWEKEIERVLAEKDYGAALRYYKTKGLSSEADAVFGMKFQNQIMLWLRGTESAPFVAALRAAMPVIPIQGAVPNV